MNAPIKNSLPKKRLKKGINLIPFFNDFVKHISHTYPRSGFQLYALFFVLYALNLYSILSNLLSFNAAIIKNPHLHSNRSSRP